MTEKELKQRCINAVTSRATKQKPEVRQVIQQFFSFLLQILYLSVHLQLCSNFLQVKILRDSEKGNSVRKNKSRGLGFVEFSEHQHALVALRVLNNNPGTWFYNLVVD